MLLNANPKKTYACLFLFCLAVLSIPMFLRIKLDDGNYIGQESYFNYRLANEIKENGFVKYDDLSYSGREIRYEWGLPFILSLSPDFMMRVLPLLLGLLSFTLFYFIVRKYDNDIALVSSLLLICSPAFIYLFSVPIKLSCAVFFCLLGVYLFISGSGIYRWLSYFSFLAVAFFSVEAVFLLALAGIYFAFKKRVSWAAYFSMIILSFILLYIQFGWLLFSFKAFFQQTAMADFASSFGMLFSDIGGRFGFGIFLFILVLVGIYTIWAEKYRYIFVYCIAVLLLLAAIYEPLLVFFLNFFAVILAAYGILYLIDMEWRSTVFRGLTLLVIICGILFSAVSFMHNVAAMEPSKEMIYTMDYLRSVGGDSVVFSDYSNGVYINIAGKKNIADSNFLGAPDAEERLNDIDIIFHAKRIEEARDLLEKYNSRYILIDSRLKSKYYASDDSELLFLLKYSPNDFYMLYNNTGVELWGVYSGR